MSLLKAIEKISEQFVYDKEHYFFVLYNSNKPRLLVFPLTLRGNPLLSIGGRRAINLYNIARKVIKEYLDVDDIDIPRNKIKFFHVSPDIGETIIIWLISQLTASNPSEELLSAMLKFGVPTAMRDLREELYRKSRNQLVEKKYSRIQPLIDSRLAISISKSMRKILNALIP